MLIIDIISVVPELLVSPFNHSMMKRAKDRSLLEINVISLRDYGIGKHKQIDDYQYGGGAGMVMMPEPLDHCIMEYKSKRSYDHIIFLTPDGHTYNQKWANRLSLSRQLLLICGHYKGIDERIRKKHVTLEISIGDYVLSGGELAAAVLVDSLGRLIPGVLNDESSALSDSFQDQLLSPPVYTRPAEYDGMKVPDVLLSGNDAWIEKWRDEQAYLKTRQRRPDLLSDQTE
ncbi:MAG TPA: tRNA (guanosine(37)-N1)-methyltransferase TrmD [Saprospiraceae bacterium]|nr:tRNA (guanosine(37)-N1)-methyltransferase TrmD [Saprospiraceae bacterium]